MVLGSCSTSGYLIGRSRTGSSLSPSFPCAPGRCVKKILRARPDAARASGGGFLGASSRTERSAPIPGLPSRPVQQGAAWLRMPTAGLVRAVPAKAAAISWVLESRRSSLPRTEGGGRSQRRRGWHSERLENILTLAAPGPLSQTERPGLRLRLGVEGVPVAGKLGPAVSAAVEHQARKPESLRSSRLGKGWGCHRPRPPRGRAAGAGGAPPRPKLESPPAAWPLIVRKLGAPGNVPLVEGGLGFLLLDSLGLPGRPPPPFLTRL